MEESKTIERVLAGDREAFRAIVDSYQAQVYRLVYSVLKHPKDAEDTAQEVFVKLYLSLPQYHGQGFKTWVSRLAVNHAIDVSRRRARSREELVEAPGELREALAQGPAAAAARRPAAAAVAASAAVMAGERPVEQAYALRERARDLERRIHEMPENYREVIQAYYIREQSYQEIAAEQGVEVKTVESKLYRARKWMREHWKEEDFR
nr:sigma-70 family RNA polymerase sigma factor [Paenibacillus swuensis]